MRADLGQLNQVTLNMAVNSRDGMLRGGRIKRTGQNSSMLLCVRPCRVAAAAQRSETATKARDLFERGAARPYTDAPETTLWLLWRLLLVEVKWKSSDPVALI